MTTGHTSGMPAEHESTNGGPESALFNVASRPGVAHAIYARLAASKGTRIM